MRALVLRDAGTGLQGGHLRPGLIQQLRGGVEEGKLA
jgi:hypothetical protein